MKQQAIEKADRLMNVEAGELASQKITDLNLTEAEANEIKGGPLCHGKTVLAWARVDGVSASNHNETVAEDEANASEALIDLTVDHETSARIQGGTSLQYDLKFLKK